MNSNVVYFSPTGGTKAVAELIINDLGSQVFDMTVSVLPSFFNEDDIVFFLVPVYGGRIPKPVYERMKLMHGSNTPAVVITVYGNHTVGDALLEMKKQSSKSLWTKSWQPPALRKSRFPAIKNTNRMWAFQFVPWWSVKTAWDAESAPRPAPQMQSIWCRAETVMSARPNC